MGLSGPGHGRRSPGRIFSVIISPAGKEGSVRLLGSVPPESAGLTCLAELSRGRDLLTSPERRNIFVDEVRMGFRADFERA